MFAFGLFFKLYFWAVCFIFAYDELNALIFLFALQVMEMLKLGNVTRVATKVITYGKTEITSNFYIKT